MSTSHPERDRSLPPGASQRLVALSKWAKLPVERFLHIEAASGILLLLAALAALVWVHSPWAPFYNYLWQMPLGFTIGPFAFDRTLEWYVNDVLMVVFFFVVGLEIRREIHRGELSEWRRASLPVVAALGGMLLPALIYLQLAGGPGTRSGWGVPMATDIAFAVGILTLLGKRVPPALRVLLLAVAVIDDLGAILVIAFFYSAGISVSGLCVAAAGFAGVLLLQRLAVRSKVVYLVPGIIAWAGIYQAGIHPTIAGVILGLMTPVTPWLGADGFVKTIEDNLGAIRDYGAGKTTSSSPGISSLLHSIEKARAEVLSPADSLIETLHPWVAFVIMPIFALANSGVSLVGGSFDQNSLTIIYSVALGLFVGKPLGILLFTGIALRSGIATLPQGINRRHLLVLGIVAGIGFTMALFIAQLAFSEPSLLVAAKLGILAASGLAGLLALGLGYLLLNPTLSPKAAMTADEAEISTDL
jgi:NhaA family Na+:H+ antiporter